MPNWQELVRRELAGLDLEPHERAEVIEEIAAHLDDVYAGLRGQGLAEEDAIKRSLGEVEDWQNLRRRIQIARRKENVMPKRVAQFWLPSFVTLTLSMVVLMLAGIFVHAHRIEPRSGWSMMVPPATIYMRWLLSLILIGAIGAFLSQRAGGSQRAVFFSIVFPVLPYLAFFLVELPVTLLFNDQLAHIIMLPALLAGLLAWVLIPGAALLAGGLPTQLFLSRRPSTRGALAQ
jgi:hypothetical protein